LRPASALNYALPSFVWGLELGRHVDASRVVRGHDHVGVLKLRSDDDADASSVWRLHDEGLGR
jgi:hypothetical protein